MSTHGSNDEQAIRTAIEQRYELLDYYLSSNFDNRYRSTADTPPSRPASIISGTETSFDNETDFDDSDNEEDELSELIGHPNDVNHFHRTKVVGTLAKDGSHCAICGTQGIDNLMIIRLLDWESPGGLGVSKFP